MSDSLVKQELRDLFLKYKTRMESEGKKVKTGGGFGGTGFKFDEAEAQYTTEKKKYQKAALGLQDSDDEDVEEEIDAQIEQLLSAKRTVKNIDSASAAAMLGPGAAVAGQDGAPVALDKLALAKQLA